MLKNIYSILGFVFLNPIQAQTPQDSFFINQGIWIEKLDSLKSKNDVLSYTYDNQIYKAGTSFTYSLKIEDSLQNQYVCNFYHLDNFPAPDWELVPERAADSTSVRYLTMEVPRTAVFEHPAFLGTYTQTQIRFDYKNTHKATFGRYYPADHWNPDYQGKFRSDGEGTGVIENKKNIWIHPPRTRYFGIHQLTPYPFIPFPIVVGSKWSWELLVGGHWGNKRWAEWKENVLVTSAYEVQEKIILNTAFGKLECYRVACEGKSPFGKTYLTYYFNPDYGFVLMEFTSIDGKKTILELIEKSQF
jgi:hypothetical protein